MRTPLHKGETVLKRCQGEPFKHGERRYGTLFLTTRRLVMETSVSPVTHRLRPDGPVKLAETPPEVFFERPLVDVVKMTPRCEKDINGRISLLPNTIGFIIGGEEPFIINLGRDIGTWIFDIGTACESAKAMPGQPFKKP